MTIFPTKILLATDGSEDATLAGQLALEIAAKTGSELHIVHVLGVPTLVEVAEWEPVEQAKRQAQAFLDRQVEQIKAGGVRVVESYLRRGRPPAEIVRLSEELGVGLIIVGSRGLGAVRRALMGSVSHAVVRHAHCPVLVARPAGEEGAPVSFLDRILVATDGSKEAALAFEMAVGLATRLGSELHLVTVGGEYHPGYEISGHPALLEETRRELEREARQLLDQQVKTIEEAGASVADAHLAIEGRPEAEIVRVGEEVGAGLIVLGSRGRGPLRRALLGTVSDSVVRLAHCPVLVAREDAHEGPDARPRRGESGERASFWEGIFGGSYHSGREAKVLEYIMHRIGDGAHLGDVVQEEYVRRLTSPEEVEQILDNPKLIEAARKALGEDFSSGKLDPH